jgi:hypothetical protein
MELRWNQIWRPGNACGLRNTSNRLIVNLARSGGFLQSVKLCKVGKTPGGFEGSKLTLLSLKPCE